MEIVVAFGIGAWIMFSGIFYCYFIKHEIRRMREEQE